MFSGFQAQPSCKVHRKGYEISQKMPLVQMSHKRLWKVLFYMVQMLRLLANITFLVSIHCFKIIIFKNFISFIFVLSNKNCWWLNFLQIFQGPKVILGNCLSKQALFMPCKILLDIYMLHLALLMKQLSMYLNNIDIILYGSNFIFVLNLLFVCIYD